LLAVLEQYSNAEIAAFRVPDVRTLVRHLLASAGMFPPEAQGLLGVAMLLPKSLHSGAQIWFAPAIHKSLNSACSAAPRGIAFFLY
jgi:hypothetical protein